MNTPNPDHMREPDKRRKSDTPDRGPESSFLQMFLEARPPREDSRSTD